MNQQEQANLIKIAAVVTAAPRWVGALLAAEGLTLPEDWRWWWVIVSAALSACMALVEGLAFAYVFNAWRMQRDKAANRLLWLAILSAVVFIIVLAPFIAAQVRQTTLEAVLGTGWALWLWSAAVAASTIVIVASVGYAQKQKDTAQNQRTAAQADDDKPQATPEPPQTVRKRRATVADWRAIYAGANGECADISAEGVRLALDSAGLAPPAPRTLQAWAKEALENAVRMTEGQ